MSGHDEMKSVVSRWHAINFFFRQNLATAAMSSSRSRGNAASGFVYQANGPTHDSPYCANTYSSRHGNHPPSRERRNRVLLPLTSGELTALKYATFVQVQARTKSDRIPITSDDFDSLRTRGLLNDSVLDAFFALLQARNFEQVPRELPSYCQSEDDDVILVPRPRVFLFNTYLYTSLMSSGEYNYKRVESWFRKLGGNFEQLDIVMIPVNIRNKHWVLVVLNLREESVLFYDPYHNYNSSIVHNCKRWLKDEFASADYTGMSDPSTWKRDESDQNYPIQTDSSSCGIFIAFVAEAVERGCVPEFKQSDTDLLRKRLLVYLLDGTIE